MQVPILLSHEVCLSCLASTSICWCKINLFLLFALIFSLVYYPVFHGNCWINLSNLDLVLESTFFKLSCRFWSNIKQSTRITSKEQGFHMNLWPLVKSLVLLYTWRATILSNCISFYDHCPLAIICWWGRQHTFEKKNMKYKYYYVYMYFLIHMIVYI